MVAFGAILNTIDYDGLVVQAQKPKAFKKMAKGYKFGTFAGVFTPSILTILGVIMYLRLGWVVGQAGLIGAIGIILAAHIISVSTGLSVSSIATDKRVKAGGVYYIISRSLGLSIGGALGIALYAGTSFSIALYIIGFGENFNEFFGLGTTINDLRLTGTIVLIAISTLAFISTSLALKAQFFVLAAIGISLISIIFGTHEFIPTHLPLLPGKESVSLSVVFGIFFPAVTGFTAGIAMSGDLKNPARAIPIGTILAIGVGLVVYIGLAIFIAMTVDGEALRTDNNILMRIAWTPGFLPVGIFVSAGIWSATLSSAMGGILGAPRILQALSVDKVTPKFLGKGVGDSNEPRNALIFTVILAEMAILIGELDIIARIVSMFYITTYGFLNLTYAIENWASPDFRPEFKIPNWVSIIGAITCFFIMIQLDVLAMIGSTVLMFLIFIYIKQKELGTEGGDVWAGVWFTLVKSGLFKLNRNELHERNWQPNIILFSGGTEARPHLIQFGKWLVRNRGILFNFDLIEDKTVQVLFTKSNQSVRTESDEFSGIFSRRQTCRDVYDGMEMIARSYGLSGMEPNTVLMGWARNSQEPLRFVELLYIMAELDYNVLLLDYDQRFGFGKHKKIDIWWRGSGNNITLSLMLVKFILSSDVWREATVRILIVNDDSSLTNRIYKNMYRGLEEYRIHADVKIINNAIEQRRFRDLIKLESIDADLTIIGMPDVTNENVDKFVDNTNWLLHEIGTVLLIRASSYFEEIFVGIERKQSRLTKETIDTQDTTPAITYPANEIIARALRQLNQSVEGIIFEYDEKYLKEMYGINQMLLENISDLILRNFNNLERSISDSDQVRIQRGIIRAYGNILFQSRKILAAYKDDNLILQKEASEEGINWLFSRMTNLTRETPQSLSVSYERDKFDYFVGDTVFVQIFKLWQKTKAKFTKKDPVWQKIRFQAYVKYYLEINGRNLFYKLLEEVGINSYQHIYDIQKLLELTKESMALIDKRLNTNAFSTNLIKKEKEKLRDLMKQMKQSILDQYAHCHQSLLIDAQKAIEAMGQDLMRVEANYLLKTNRKVSKSAEDIKDKILETPNLWIKNQILLVNLSLTDLTLSALQNRLSAIVQRMMNELSLNIKRNIIENIQKLNSDLIAFIDQLKTNPNTKLFNYTLVKNEFDQQAAINKLITEIQKATQQLPETIEVMSEESLNNIENQQFEEPEVLSISLRRLVEYLIEIEFVKPLQGQMAELPLKLGKAISTVQDAFNLIDSNLDDLETELIDTQESVVSMIAISIVNEGIGIINDEQKRIEDLLHQLNTTTEQQLKHTFEKINPYFITRSTGDLSQYMQQQQVPPVLSKFELEIEQMKSHLVKLWYQQSQGVLLARRLQTDESPPKTQIDEILTLIDVISPQQKIMEELPFYYKQLFIGKLTISAEFWIEPPAEFKRIENVVRRFRRGLKGGLMILGERNAGKTSFSISIANRFFEPRKIYQIDPPQGGTIDRQVFENTLTHKLNIEGNINYIFDNLPLNSVLIFNDLELWWERSQDGLTIIHLINDLINKYGHKHFFMVNTNPYSFQFMNRLQKIEHCFLDVVDCPPFDAEKLRDVILLRHRSTGLKFELAGQFEEDIPAWKLARLFTAHFNCSRGNVGNALHSWIRHIRYIDHEKLVIQIPILPDLRPLDRLEKDWIVIIIQFILHKKLTFERFKRVIQKNETIVRREIETLKRAGILIENTNDVLEINPFLQSHLVQKLTELGVL